MNRSFKQTSSLPGRSLIFTFFWIMVFLQSGRAFGQDVFEIKGVPINIEGDGLDGYVDFRAQAFCGGEPRIRLAVDRIVIEGIHLDGVYYDKDNELEGFSFPIKASSGGLRIKGYLNTSYEYVSHELSIDNGNISAQLGGFMDWIVISEGEFPHEMTCSEWQDHVINNIASYSYHGLEIFKEECLKITKDDGCLFYDLKAGIEKTENAEEYLEQLKYDLSNVQTSNEAEEVLRKLKAYDWPKSATNMHNRVLSELAEEVKDDARYKIKQLSEKEEESEEEEEMEVATSDQNTVAFKSESKSDDDKEEMEDSSPDNEDENANREEEQDFDHIAWEAERQVKYNAAMQKAENAVEQNDFRTAKESYEEAHLYNPSQETQDYATAASVASSLQTTLHQSISEWQSLESFKTQKEGLSNINAEDFSGVMREFHQKSQQLDAVFENRLNERTREINNAVASYKDGSSTDALADLVGEMSKASEEKKLRKEKEKIQARLEDEKEEKLQEFAGDLSKKASRNKESFLNAAKYSITEEEEDYYLAYYRFYFCVESNARFYLTNNSYCEKPYLSKPKALSHITTDDLYSAYKRKSNSIYDEIEEGAVRYLEMAIKKAPNNSTYLYEKYKISTYDPERLALIQRLVDLNPDNSYYSKESVNEKNRFKKKFFTAIKEGNTAYVRDIVSRQLHLGLEHKGEAPLSASITSDNAFTFDILYTDHKKNGYDYSAYSLADAAVKNSTQVLELLLDDKSVNPDLPYRNVYPLHYTVSNGSQEAFNLLLKKGADYQLISNRVQRDSKLKGQMARMMRNAAIANNNPELFNASLSFANPDSKELTQYLSSCLQEGYDEMAVKLINEYQPENSKGEYSTPFIHGAVIADNPVVLEALVENGYESSLHDYRGNPAAHYLTSSSSNILNTDLWRKLDLNAKDQEGVSLLHKSLFSEGSNTLFHKLLKSGKVELDATGLYGWTALHYAVRENNYEMVNTLLVNGADRNIKDQWGRTPEDIAKERGLKSIKRIL